jgi:uncharacterized protein (DUF433 family)
VHFVMLEIAAEPVPLQMDAHGALRVAGTRVTLDTLVAIFEEGASAEEIAHEFPSLTLADVYAVITYYLRHRADVDAYLQARESKADEVRRKVEARIGGQHGLRERLLARRMGQTRD